MNFTIQLHNETKSAKSDYFLFIELKLILYLYTMNGPSLKKSNNLKTK